VAGALAQAGQHEQAARVAARAEKLARSIISQDLQALEDALPAVAGAGALAQAGQHEQAARAAARAETLARSLTSPDQQAMALAAVAGALAQAGQAGQAARVAVSACAAGRGWMKVLGLVLSLEPSAIAVVADLCPDVPRNAEQGTGPPRTLRRGLARLVPILAKYRK
jgi:hypothetical protein